MKEKVKKIRQTRTKLDHLDFSHIFPHLDKKFKKKYTPEYIREYSIGNSSNFSDEDKVNLTYRFWLGLTFPQMSKILECTSEKLRKQNNRLIRRLAAGS